MALYDLRPEEWARIKELTDSSQGRCAKCTHLISLHRYDGEWDDSYCDVEGCGCCLEPIGPITYPTRRLTFASVASIGQIPPLEAAGSEWLLVGKEASLPTQQSPDGAES